MFKIVHTALVSEKGTLQIVLMALVFSTKIPAYYKDFCQHMAQIKLNTIQIVHTPHYEKLLIQIVNMAHICENDTIQIKVVFQIVAT